MKTKTKSLILLFLTVIFWGLAYPILSNILASGMETGTVNIFRFGFAVIALILLFGKNLKHITKDEWILSLVCGFLLFGGFLFISLSMDQPDASPSLSALIVGLGIFVVPLLTFLVFHKKTKWLTWVGIVLAFAGIYLFSMDTSFQMTWSIGLLYSFISAILFGVQIFLLASYMGTKNEKTVTILQNAVVLILFIIYVLIFERKSFSFNFDWTIWLQLLFLGVCGTALAYYFQTYASKYVSANVCNIVLGLESFFAVVFSLIMGLDTLTIFYIFGTILILVGTWLVLWQENKSDIKAVSKKTKNKGEKL